jgi:Ca-activated chloride channel family protein
MIRFLACATLAVCVLATAVAAGQQPVFRGSGDVVKVFATVTDGDGRLVTTLTQADFELRDEGKPQPITLFDNTPTPIRLIVMLDVSGSMEGNLPLLRAAAQQLFMRLRPDDKAKVGAFGKDITISPEFTWNPDELRRQLPDRIDPEAPTPLWRALDEAADTFDSESEERRVILVLSDGKDSGPMTPADFKRKVPSQIGVIERARAEDVMIYAIGMRSRGARRGGAPGLGIGGLQQALLEDLPDSGLARVAEETGGGYVEIRGGEDLSAAFAKVADELHSQYLLGFDPPKRDGKVHDIDLRVAKKGLKARGRRSYVAPRA